MLLIPICLALMTFGISVVFVDFLDPTSGLELTFFATASVVLFAVGLPAVGLIIGFAKIRRKPGIYLRGIRVTDSGIEVGTLTIDPGLAGSAKIWERTDSNTLLDGNWTPGKRIENEGIDILIVLRRGCENTRLLVFERFVVTSRKAILYQLIGKNKTETLWHDLVVLANGSFRFLGDSQGVPPHHLFPLLELAADVISTCRPSNPPSCTLKIASSSANLNNVLAFGMLGGAVAARVNHREDFLENNCDRDFAQSLRKFLKKSGWSLQAEE